MLDHRDPQQSRSARAQHGRESHDDKDRERHGKRKLPTDPAVVCAGRVQYTGFSSAAGAVGAQRAGSADGILQQLEAHHIPDGEVVERGAFLEIAPMEIASDEDRGHGAAPHCSSGRH
jgi:hypothetical protein